METPKDEISTEQLVQMLTKLLRASDLSFLGELRKEDLEQLVAAVRSRIEK